MCETIKLPLGGSSWARLQVTPTASVSIFEIDVRERSSEVFYVSSLTVARITLFWQGAPKMEVHKDVGVAKIVPNGDISRVVVEGPTAPVSLWFERDTRRECAP